MFVLFIFVLFFFFFNDTPPTEIYTLSLHDALPISMATFLGLLPSGCSSSVFLSAKSSSQFSDKKTLLLDRKSTRLNSSHSSISYAVFCLKKKKKTKKTQIIEYMTHKDTRKANIH